MHEDFHHPALDVGTKLRRLDRLDLTGRLNRVDYRVLPRRRNLDRDREPTPFTAASSGICGFALLATGKA